ncbi:hypothetical protein DL766_009631 [Monosporascus sp. MC13-8B]|uniref:Uncharacterized protein n=1 Tax=Monosporascus cannonballus TaxID=155416 RepID=A0ABY0H6L4_9PEZI|nr:hypothetical protein DL762_006440 [Monosporascus cannonballus]RYO86007.1 hypothetical protein DL763_006877 [Monosporascus cannonballus]RYP14572.1 hypothetical protein DL766_009631 [Monosporascus sp. MC13-8B]
MCRQITTERYDACDHTVEVDSGRNAPFCLLENLCKEVNYAHKIFRRLKGTCPDCAGTAKKSLLANPWPEPRTPYYLADKERCPAAALEVAKRILADDSLTDRGCRDLLYYILGLLGWTKKGQLVSEFAYAVRGYYGAAWEAGDGGDRKEEEIRQRLRGGICEERG